MIDSSVKKLVCYGLEKGLITERDECFTVNRILEILKIDSYSCDEFFENVNLEETLKELLDYAVEMNIIDDNITEQDLFDTKLMSALMPRPSEVTEKFNSLYKVSPKIATDYYFKLSGDSDYIRRYRVVKDLKWKSSSEYGDFDITINLSKPEKDPKAIAAAKNAPQSSYPKCLLCKECEGYSGRMNFPARQNHRVIPVVLAGEEWSFQYSPYVYYNEHCIVFNNVHTPMVINEKTFRKLLDFVKMFPHYFLGSNAGLPVVGGSILSHEHYQGGCYTFAMAKAEIEHRLSFDGFEDVEAGILKWPMSVIRLRCEDTERLISLAAKILNKWEAYTDEDSFIFAETKGEMHNAITPIARKNGDKFELDLVLRNNITTEEHPFGVFHPHTELHHIKKENIGLIEVMGLAVLPSRLKTEMSLLSEAILSGKDIKNDEVLSKHADWAEEIKAKYNNLSKDNIDEILKTEIGIVFKKVLEDCGVFKRTEEGKKAFLRFAESVN